MNKLPWGRSISGAAHRESGGFGDLQTDVMRFMAILAFCLVAIFAIVQSIPLGPAKQPQQPESAAVLPKPPESQPAPELPPEPVVVQPEIPPEPEPVAEPAPVPEVPDPPPASRLSAIDPPSPVLPAPARTPVPVRKPEPQPEPPPVEEVGFSLQFESDAALRSLVEAGEVALYASVRSKTWRMAASRGTLSFHPAQPPAQIHLMSPSTVPPEVAQALRRTTVVVGRGDVTWGVTLPVSATIQLRQLMRRHKGGSLVIRPDGQIALERRS